MSLNHSLLVNANQSVVASWSAFLRRIMSLGPSRVSWQVNNVCHGMKREVISECYIFALPDPNAIRHPFHSVILWFSVIILNVNAPNIYLPLRCELYFSSRVIFLASCWVLDCTFSQVEHYNTPAHSILSAQQMHNNTVSAKYFLKSSINNSHEIPASLEKPAWGKWIQIPGGGGSCSPVTTVLGSR